MTSAIVNLTDENNRFLNIVKAHFDLRNKSDAINFIVGSFSAGGKLEPGTKLRPQYALKLRKLMAQRGKVYPSAEAMFKEFEKDV